MGLGERVVMDLAEPLLDQNFHLYFDNFFASPSLAARLLSRQTYCIGTVRSNRTGYPRSVGNITPRNSARGSSSSAWANLSSMPGNEADKKVHCVTWIDKKQVTAFTTFTR